MIPVFKISRIRDSLKNKPVQYIPPVLSFEKIHHVEVRYWISGIEKQQVKTLVRIVQTAIQEMLKLMRERGETDITVSDHSPRGNNVYLVLRSAKGFDPELLSIFLSYLYFEPVQDNFWFQFWQNKQRVIDLHRYDPQIALNPVPDDSKPTSLFGILQDTLPLLDIPFQSGNNGNSYSYIFDALGDKEYKDATCDRIYIGFFRERTSEQVKAYRKEWFKNTRTSTVPEDKLIAFADVGNDAVRMSSAEGEENHPISKHIQRLTLLGAEIV
jgi:hypothetical protein